MLSPKLRQDGPPQELQRIIVGKLKAHFLRPPYRQFTLNAVSAPHRLIGQRKRPQWIFYINELAVKRTVDIGPTVTLWSNLIGG